MYNQSGVRFHGYSILYVGLKTDPQVCSMPRLPLRTSLHRVDSLRKHHHIQQCVRSVHLRPLAIVRQIHLSVAYHKLLRFRNPMLCSLHARLHRSQQSQEEKT